MSSKLFSFLKFLILLIIAGALLAFAFKGISVRVIFHEMLQAKISWLLISVGFSVIAFISRAYRWNMLIEPLGYHPPLRKTTYALMIGYFVNLALPRLGEVTRCGSLSKAESIPFSSLLGTVIVERVIDVITLLACLFLVTIIEFERIGNFLNTNIFQPIVGKWESLIHSPIAISALVLFLGVILFFILYSLKRAGNRGKDSKLGQLITGLISGLRTVASLKRPWVFVFHSVLIWVLGFLGIYICFFSLPSTSHLGFNAALFLLVAGGFGMSAPVQGGIGAFHLLVSQGLILYGISLQDGLTFATLIHTLSLLMVVILGITSLFLLFVENKRNANRE